MRKDQDNGVLKKCPTCDTPVADAKQLSLRDYTWVNEKLPEKLGLMDFDGVLHQYPTGRMLVLEFKPPGARLSMGARLTFAALVQSGYDVWVIWDMGKNRVKVGQCNDRGHTPVVKEMTRNRCATLVKQWWEAGVK